MLDMPDHIYNWFVHYYKGHSHCTTFKGALSDLLEITASIIQGSGSGPSSFLVNASDLHTINKENTLIKFADDTNLIVSAKMKEHVSKNYKILKIGLKRIT